ncbi:MAG: RsmE family RNA methyltransferase, partial [bacterium]
IDQCTQLGVACIQPLLSKMVSHAWKAGRGENKVERWRRVAIAALKQSCGTVLPELCAPVTLDTYRNQLKKYDLVLLATPVGNPMSSVSASGSPKSVLMLSGPEEGFTGREEAALIEAGALPISLGPRRLRAELAPIVMISSLLAQLD